MTARVCKLLPAVLISGWVIGCASTTEDRFSPPPRLVRSRIFHIEDIPLPNGFEKQAKSYGSTTGTLRSFVHYYEGQAPRISVLNFYQAQMPKYHWQELALQDVDDEYTLRFEKAGEHCEIRIWNQAAKAKVRVVIQPLRRTPAAEEDPAT